MTCPVCNGPKSKRAVMCLRCRRSSNAIGAKLMIGAASAPTAEEIASWAHAPADTASARPRNSAQNGAYHGRCSTLAQLELPSCTNKQQLARAAIGHQQRALEFASARFGRTIESSKELSYDEMSDVLDWLNHQIASHDESESTAP